MTKIISAKGDTFFISYNNQLIGGDFNDATRLLAPSKKMPSFPLQFGQKENIPGNSFERRAYRSVLKTASVVERFYNG